MVLYLDDPEEGPSAATSHPRFVAVAQEDFWYSSSDDFSPFGNDTGNDTLRLLEEWLTQHGAEADVASFVKELLHKQWELDEEYLAITDAILIRQLHHDPDQFINDTQDQAIIAAALGQLKITGRIGTAIGQLAAAALQRQRIIAETAGEDETNSFRAEVPAYLERLGAMQAVMQQMS